MRQQPRDVHLRDAQLAADVRLRHVAVEAHHEHALFAFRQLAHVRPDRLAVQGRLDLRVFFAEDILKGSCVGGVGERRVQRRWLERGVSLLRIEYFADANAQIFGELLLVGSSGELLDQFRSRLPDLQAQFLHRALHMDLPSLVAEMPFDLAANARLSVGREALADGRIEVIDRLEQANVADLHEFLGRLRALPVAQRARPDHRLISADKLLASILPGLAAPRIRLDQCQQVLVIEVGEISQVA